MGGGAVDTAGSVINYTFSGGVYTVALFATNGYGCASDTSFQQITVTPAPVTAFLYNDSLCAQSPITFTSQSTSSAGSIGQYNWQFGDGATASTGNATHQFDTGGVYNVCLAVTSSFGCMDTACHQVTALTKPIAAFTAVDTCLNQQPIIFTNNSTSALFYTWDFADGNTSSSTSPVHSYAASGVYQVKLTAANNYCSTDTTEPVRVFAVPAAAFTIPEPYHCGFPVNIQLTNTSTGASGYVWNFGNGTGSTNNNPSTQYSTDGTYIISLAASNQNGCVDTVIDSFTVYPVPSISSIDILPAEGCQPLPVDFLANGTNVNHLFWNFGDGNTLNTDSVFASHIYSDTGTFSVQLMAYSYATCGDTLFLPDTVQVHIVPVAAFNFSLNENIEPENGTVLFINNSVNSTTYMWNFGDGVTSTDVNPSHLFPSIDSFTVVLIAYSTYGCADSADTTIYIIKKSLYVPNAFAPDFNAGSNLVQVWKPAGIGLLDYHAQIFNKWGELLWESTLLTADRQPAEGWDGTYQNELAQQDVYVWKIDATFIDGTRWQGMSYKFQEVRKTIGSVTLIR